MVVAHDRTRRVAVAGLLWVGTVSVAIISVWLGHLRSDYRPAVMSMSVLGERGADQAVVFDGALVLLAVALILAGVVIGRTASGVCVAVAGLVLVAVALVPIDPSSAMTTSVHRALTAGVLVSLVLAVFTGVGAAGWFTWWSQIVKWLTVIGLLLAVGLLVEGFPGGVWERAMFLLLLGWVELYLVDLIHSSARTSLMSAAS